MGSTASRTASKPPDQSVTWRGGLLRAILAGLLPPLVAFVVQSLLWSTVISPFAWFLFYPTVFISSWLGGARSGVIATLLSAVIAWFFFIPPQNVFFKEHPGAIFAVIIFVGTGIAFSAFHERFRRANQARIDNLLIAKRATEDLERAQSVAKVGSWRLDVQHNELAWSRETHQIFGTEPGPRMTYESFLVFVHPDDRVWVDRAWKAALEGEPYDTEFRIVVDGNIKWVRGKAQLEFDEHGAVLGGIGIAQDITERKRLEEELRLSEAKCSGIIATSADGIIAIDEDQRITLFNEGAEQLFGYSKEEVMGAPLAILIPERFREIHHAQVDAYMKTGLTARRMGERNAQISHLRKNGEEFPADASISRLEVGGKRILTVSVRDITSQKKLELAQRFLLDVGSTLAAALDGRDMLANIARLSVRDIADHCIVETVENGGVIRRVEVASRDPSKSAVCDTLHHIHLDRTRPFLTSEVFETKRPVLWEEVSPDKIASLTQSEEHLAALRALDIRSAVMAPLWAHDKFYGAIALFWSNRACGPSDLELAEQLAFRVALSIENTRLHRDAARAIKARDDVLEVVAHDLRNPLATILLHAAALRRHDAEHAQNHGIAIDRAGKRMNHLIQDLLDVMRMEAQGLSIERTMLSTVELVRDVVEGCREAAAAASIELRADVQMELPALHADRNRLLQVFENLIGNALKFTAAGGHVVVGATPKNGEILFSVADTGHGLESQDLPHVFDRFWRAQDVPRSGAGLGLPIVKGIVEAHGGRVWVESTKGQGSTFFFTIPTARVTSGAVSRH